MVGNSLKNMNGTNTTHNFVLLSFTATVCSNSKAQKITLHSYFTDVCKLVQIACKYTKKEHGEKSKLEIQHLVAFWILLLLVL